VTHEEFEALVGKLEAQARRNPAAYRVRVFLLAGLGNAYLALILGLVVFLFLLLLASIFWLKALGAKLALIVGAFLWVIVRALWIRIAPPQGAEVTARQAPQLFAMIEALRRDLRAPRFHHVLVTDDFNAGVVQAPRLGIFGWPRNYLLIGLPLMKSLTVEQFKAVLAHEFGHLSRGHGRMSNWIYRQRLRWSRLIDSLETAQSKGGFLFRPFLHWFAPYFNAFSFPLARANEYEADATSVRLASPLAAAEALTSVSVVGSYLQERFWPQVHQQADEQPRPAYAPFHGMGVRVSQDVDSASAETWLKHAMETATTVDDTHPALKDRLAAIGQPPRLSLPGSDAAADRLLGSALQPLIEDFDRRWQDAIRPSWEQRYREVQERRRRLAELDARHASGAGLEPGEAYERALLTESVGDDAEGALEQLRGLHARVPDHAAACFTLGARLLTRSDEAGVALLERAMRLDEDAILRASELLRDHHWRQGRKAEADAWHERVVQRAALLQAAAQERDQITLRDKFEPHGLSEAQLAALVAQLHAVRGLRAAYLLRKRVEHFPQRLMFVLGYRATGWFQLHSKKRAAEVLRRMQESVQFPGETLIVNVEGENYRFGRKFAWKRGARVV
jgi:Zn-dependent protease with chaperone function